MTVSSGKGLAKVSVDCQQGVRGSENLCQLICESPIDCDSNEVASSKYGDNERRKKKGPKKTKRLQYLACLQIISNTATTPRLLSSGTFGAFKKLLCFKITLFPVSSCIYDLKKRPIQYV